VLTEQQQEQLVNTCSNEHSLVKFLTPHFRRIFSDMCVVNSKEFAWLETKAEKQKPDLFIIPLCNVEKKSLNSIEDRGQSDPNYLFGVPADRRIKDTVHIFDAKCNSSNKGYGEHIIHLQHMNYAHHVPVRGMYFGKSECWISSCQGNELTYREVLKWTDGGSEDRLKEFFKASVWNKVDEVSGKLGYKIFNPFQNNTLTSAFLGMGAFGRVYAVVKNDANFPSVRKRDLCAMKVVNSDNISNICSEFQRIQQHQNNCGCNLIVKVLSESCGENSSLCGYVMEPVGISVKRSMLKGQADVKVGDVLNALYRLHTHTPNPIIHGDPRLANLLITNNTTEEQQNETNPEPSTYLRWIDLFHTVSGDFLMNVSAQKIKDMRILVTSILGKQDILEEISNAIDQYGVATDEDSLQKLERLIMILF
jgi:hypothetical protein